MLTDEIKDYIHYLAECGATSSYMEDLLEKHPDIPAREAWNHWAEQFIPSECAGCKYVQCSGMSPCTICARQHPHDFYEAR